MVFSTPIHTSEQSIDRVLATGLPLMLVFEQPDCAVCRQLEPALEQLAGTYAGRVLIARINHSASPVLARRYQITNLPGLVFVKHGQVLAQAAGAANQASLRPWFDYLTYGGIMPAVPQGPVSSPGGIPRAAAHVAPGDAAGPLPLSDATFDQLIGRDDRPVLVDFWAPWCGPCRALAPTIAQMAREFAGRALIASVNVDENPGVASRFGIISIPTLCVFRKGQMVERLVGAQSAPVVRKTLARHTV